MSFTYCDGKTEYASVPRGNFDIEFQYLAKFFEIFVLLVGTFLTGTKYFVCAEPTRRFDGFPHELDIKV